MGHGGELHIHNVTHSLKGNSCSTRRAAETVALPVNIGLYSQLSEMLRLYFCSPSSPWIDSTTVTVSKALIQVKTSKCVISGQEGGEEEGVILWVNANQLSKLLFALFASLVDMKSACFTGSGSQPGAQDPQEMS